MITPDPIPELTRVAQHLLLIENNEPSCARRKDILRARLAVLRMLRNELRGRLALARLSQEVSLT